MRVSETTGSNATFYLNDPQNPAGYTKAVEESTTVNSTTPARSYLLGTQIIAQSDSNGVLYLMRDGHGSTRALLTSAGAIFTVDTLQERYDYDAYGTMLLSANGQSIAASAKTLWLFANDGIVDPVTGWRYNLARYVNGFWFTQSDVQGMGHDADPISLHKYIYTQVNPNYLPDPSGRGESIASTIISFGIQAGLYAIRLGRVAYQYEQTRKFIDLAKIGLATLNAIMAASSNVSEMKYKLDTRTAAEIGFIAGLTGGLLTQFVNPTLGSAVETGSREVADQYFSGGRKSFTPLICGRIAVQVAISAGVAYGITRYGKLELSTNTVEGVGEAIVLFVISLEGNSLGTYVPRFFFDYMNW